MSRRGENIYKRKDGRWEGRIPKAGGKYQYFYAKTYKEVKEKIKRFHEDKEIFEKKKLSEKPPELFNEWLEGSLSRQIKPSTYESYYNCMHNYVFPFFQRESTKEITVDSVKEFVKTIRLDAGIAETSKRKVLTIFKIALKEILKNSSIRQEVLNLVTLPKTEEKEVQIFTLKEQQLIEQIAMRCKDKRAIGIVVCFNTGIRLGELCGLKWSDIDLEAGTISIKRTVSRVKTFHTEGCKTTLSIGTPKSRKSVRKIPIPDFLLKRINENKANCKNENHYIFSGKEVPIDPRSYQKLFKKILSEAGLEERKFHAIRHTFATRALELHVDIKTLSEILGHSSVSITLNIYAHSLMEHKKAAIDKFNRIYIKNAGSIPFAVNSAVRLASNLS